MSNGFSRTTPLRLQSYELVKEKEKQYLKLRVNITPSNEDIKQLGEAVAKLKPVANGAPGGFKVADLTWVSPFSIEVKVVGLDGKDIATAPPLGTERFPLNLDLKKGNEMIVELPADVKNIANLRVQFSASYDAQKAKLQSVAVQSLYSDGLSAIERAIGKLPQPSDFVSRDIQQVVMRDQKLVLTLRSLNVSKEQEEEALIHLKGLLFSNKAVDPMDFDKLETVIVWTPLLGRREIEPTTTKFIETEKTLKQQSMDKFKKLLNEHIEEAKTSETFDKWYSKKHDKYKGKVETGGSASLFEIGGFSGHFNFGMDVDKLNEHKEEKKRYEALFNKLKTEKLDETETTKMFESYWKGFYDKESVDSKGFNLCQVSNRGIGGDVAFNLNRLLTSGQTTLKTPGGYVALSPELNVGSDSAVNQLKNEITTLRTQITNLQNGQGLMTRFEVTKDGKSLAKLSAEGALELSGGLDIKGALTFKGKSKEIKVFQTLGLIAYRPDGNDEKNEKACKAAGFSIEDPFGTDAKGAVKTYRLIGDLDGRKSWQNEGGERDLLKNFPKDKKVLMMWITPGYNTHEFPNFMQIEVCPEAQAPNQAVRRHDIRDWRLGLRGKHGGGHGYCQINLYIMYQD